MSDAMMKVLQMVASGQISAQEADLLLRAMGSGNEPAEPLRDAPPAAAPNPLPRDPVKALKAAVAADLAVPDEVESAGGGNSSAAAAVTQGKLGGPHCRSRLPAGATG